MRKVVHLGTKLGSFASAADSAAETLEITLTTKRVERLTERIGRERVAQRELSIAEWESLPLVEKLAAPNGIKAPAVACVSCDGGRMQRCDLPADAKSHWCETKIGVLLEIEPNPHDVDPCPQVPDKFLDLVCMEQMTREIKGAVPKGQTFESSMKSVPAPIANTPHDGSRESAASSGEKPAARAPIVAEREPIVTEPPVVVSRDVIASLADSTAFGKQLAAHAWSLGFAAAQLKSFIADGSSTNWGIWQRHFKHLEFVPILDFIHALTYAYSASMAGRTREAGGPIYLRWITWIWQGEVTRVIAEVASRLAELGAVPEGAAETDPRKIVAETLTYLTNQQSRMNYPTYRRMGLPITSSHIESTVKQISRRVKGSEKFWTAKGGESLLQLRADQLCDTAPLDKYWLARPHQSTGTRNYQQTATTLA